VWPFGSLPFVLMEIWNRRQYAFTLLALFMGLCSVIYAPTTDLYRHTAAYLAYKDMSWETFRLFTHLDVVLHYISFFFAKGGINFEIIRFLFSTTSYLIWFYIFRGAVRRNQTLSENQLWYMVCFVLVMFCANFFSITVGLRGQMAKAFIALATWQLLVEKRNLGYLWLVLAPLTHLAITPFSVMLLIVKLGIFRSNSKVFSMVVFVGGYVVGLMTMQTLVSILESGANPQLGLHMNAYVDGYWGTGGVVEDRSFRGMIFGLGGIVKQIAMLLLFFMCKDKSPLRSFILMVFMLWGLTLQLLVVSGRVSGVLMSLLLFWMLLEFDMTKHFLRLFKVTFLCCATVFLFEIYAARDYIALGRWGKMVYCPAPVLMFNNFDNEWIDEHINSDGFPHGVTH
jgi:hypothetical protein